MRLLVVEKEPKLNRLIIEMLLCGGFKVDSFATLEDALAAISVVRTYKLAVLDVDPVGDRSLAAIKEIRQKTPETIILATVAYNSFDSRIKILDAGADVFLLKPFSVAELAACCRALMRRADQNSESMALTVGNVSLDPDTNEAFIAGMRVHFTKREIDLLAQLMRRFDHVVAKTHLMDSLFAFSDGSSSNAIEAIISRVRRRLDETCASVQINTEHGIGYVLTHRGASVREMNREHAVGGVGKRR